MAASSALTSATIGRMRFTSRSCLVPNTFRKTRPNMSAPHVTPRTRYGLFPPRGSQHFPRMPFRDIADVLTAEHPRELVHLLRIVERRHRRPCRALRHTLFYNEVMCGMDRDRRQVRDAQHLPSHRRLPQALSDDVR